MKKLFTLLAVGAMFTACTSTETTNTTSTDSVVADSAMSTSMDTVVAIVDTIVITDSIK